MRELPNETFRDDLHERKGLAAPHAAAVETPPEWCHELIVSSAFPDLAPTLHPDN